jgi:hypothetical protein
MLGGVGKQVDYQPFGRPLLHPRLIGALLHKWNEGQKIPNVVKI